MATITLLPRKEFEITLTDGTIIKGQFGTWALKRFCQRRGYSLNEAGVKLSDPSLDDIVDYILSAVEYSARKENAPFSYTDVHICEWIDEMGGMQSDAFASLFRHSNDEAVTKEDAAEEKKTEY